MTKFHGQTKNYEDISLVKVFIPSAQYFPLAPKSLSILVPAVLVEVAAVRLH